MFNFSPDLQTLPSVTDFAFERLPKYMSGGEDDVRFLILRIPKQPIQIRSAFARISCSTFETFRWEYFDPHQDPFTYILLNIGR